MSDNDWGISPASLTLPPGAGPLDPHVVIGPDVPPELQTWTNTVYLQHCYYAQLSYDVTGGYIFAAFCYSDTIPDPQQINGYMEMPGGIGHLFFIQTWDSTNLIANIRYGGAGGKADIQYDGVSQARGFRVLASSATNTAAIGAETVTLTTAAIPFYNGRALEAIWYANLTGSIAGNTAQFSVRRNNIAGTFLAASSTLMNTTSSLRCTEPGRAIIRNISGATITDNLVLTLIAVNGGTVTALGQAVEVRYLEVRDVGSASQYPNAIQI